MAKKNKKKFKDTPGTTAMPRISSSEYYNKARAQAIKYAGGPTDGDTRSEKFDSWTEGRIGLTSRQKGHIWRNAALPAAKKAKKVSHTTRTQRRARGKVKHR